MSKCKNYALVLMVIPPMSILFTEENGDASTPTEILTCPIPACVRACVCAYVASSPSAP